MKDAERLGQEFAAKAGAASVADLRKLSAAEVVAAAAGGEGITWPVIDGHVLPDDQYKMRALKNVWSAAWRQAKNRDGEK